MSKKVILCIKLYHYQLNEGYKITGPHFFHLHGSPQDFNTFTSIIVIVNAVHWRYLAGYLLWQFLHSVVVHQLQDQAVCLYPDHSQGRSTVCHV